MFTRKERNILEIPYFEIIRIEENFYELRSKNTKHCWIIWKNIGDDSYRRITIYHKHKQKDPYYHNHAGAHNVLHAVKLIMGHDDYVLHPERYTYARKEKRACQA